MISFIVPYRDREVHLKYLPDNIDANFNDYEILIGEQDDTKLFKKGQILNILVTLSKYDILVFMDVDCRFIETPGIIQELDTHKAPIIPWYYRQEYLELGPNEFKKLKGEHYPNGGFGGISYWNKKQYYDSNGCSNLCSGWAAEDSIMFLRTKHRRDKKDLCHIKHRNRLAEFDRDITRAQSVHHNRLIWKMTRGKQIDPKDDGINQTIAKIEEKDTLINNCRHFMISNITVPESFKYKHLLPQED